ncbi:MAG TPA: alpha/beta fold hydrolase, partial [Candidatus Limnocylindria bacterium]|nr:alpha/beta fold hydrolase [Candidatus Limnocylindria bacterium]
MTLVNGARHWTASEGTGPPVVLLHGGPGVCDYLAPVVPMLSDRWTVRRYEQRGCGRSEAVGPYAMATLAADLDALVDAWGHERVALVGHSFGAALALYYAIQRPERVLRLVLWCGMGIAFGWEAEHRANVEARLGAEELRRFDALRAALRAGAADAAAHEEWGRLLALADLADRRNAHLIPDPVFAYPTNFEANRELNADWKRVVGEERLAERARRLAVPTRVWNAAGDP